MARPKRKQFGTPGIVGYVRCSTSEQTDSGLGLDAQRTALRDEAQRRGLPLVALYEDPGLSAKDLNRPGLQAALAALDQGDGTILAVSKLDRLSRSVHHATGLMLRAEATGWGLVALDAAVDTTTPQGAAMAQVLAVFAELERKLIGQRTRDALAAKKAQGVRLGRPRSLDVAVADRIVGERAAGASWSSISRGLEADRVPTAQGGTRSYPATVRFVHESRTTDAT